MLGVHIAAPHTGRTHGVTAEVSAVRDAVLTDVLPLLTKVTCGPAAAASPPNEGNECEARLNWLV